MGTSTRDPIMADQTERAFQKQPTIFANKKGGLKPSESRFFCNPGLGFKIPNEAKTGNYVDKKCPRFEKRHKNMSVHLSPCFRDVMVGDVVTVGECRPLSKTVKFNTLKVVKGAASKKSFTKF